MAEHEKKSQTGRNVLGLIITVLVGIGLTWMAIPFLLFAACLPLVWAKAPPAWWAFASYFVLFFAVALLIAVRTTNRGVRWGIAALFGIFICVALYYLL